MLIALQQSLTLAFIPVIRGGQYAVSYWLYIYVFLGLVTVLPLLVARSLEPYDVRVCARRSLLSLMLLELAIGFTASHSSLSYVLRVAEALPASMLSTFGRVYMARNVSDTMIAKAMPIIVACTSIAPFAAPAIGQGLAVPAGVFGIHVFLSLLAFLSLFAVSYWWSPALPENVVVNQGSAKTVDRVLVLFIFLIALTSMFEHLYVSDMTLVISHHYDEMVLIQFLYAGEVGIVLSSACLFMGLKLDVRRSMFALALFGFCMFALLSNYERLSTLLLITGTICFLLGLSYGTLNARIVSMARQKPYFWNSLASFVVGVGIFVFSYLLEQRGDKSYPALVAVAAYLAAATLFIWLSCQMILRLFFRQRLSS
jgi:hypothetical protein